MLNGLYLVPHHILDQGHQYDHGPFSLPILEYFDAHLQRIGILHNLPLHSPVHLIDQVRGLIQRRKKSAPDSDMKTVSYKL